MKLRLNIIIISLTLFGTGQVIERCDAVEGGDVCCSSSSAGVMCEYVPH